MSQSNRQSPSQLLNIREWAEELTGMPDLWTAIQFDAAVREFGVRIENLLNELDEDGKPVHRLQDLLAESQPVGVLSVKQFTAQMQARGAFGRKRIGKPQAS